MRTLWRQGAAGVAVVVLLPVLAPATAGAAEPVRLTFDKTAVSADTWTGTVDFGDGAETGQLTTRLHEGSWPSGEVLHVTFDWVIDAGDRSFTAELDGVLNLETGSVVMNGTVVDGWAEGARVHEVGTLVDPASGRFTGTIQVQDVG